MKYVPEEPPINPTPESLADWCIREFRRIEAAVNQVHDHETLHAEPARLYDGMVRYADGTNWNPGSGEGLYERNNGAWVKL